VRSECVAAGSRSCGLLKDWIPDSFWLVLINSRDKEMYLQSAEGDRLCARLQSYFGNDKNTGAPPHPHYWGEGIKKEEKVYR
jgi:hypothetical protein